MKCNRIPKNHRVATLMVAAALTCAVAGTATAAEPKRGGTLTIGLQQDPMIVDPIRAGTFAERQFGQPVYESLFDIDPSGKPIPWLAESFTVSDDGKTWRIRLRQGVKFHDGTPLDAAAVVANLERTRNPANRCRCLTLLGEFKEVKAIDPQTVEISLTQANYALPVILAEAPGTMVSPKAFRADAQGIGTKPVGTGPFRFVEWIRNSRYVVERNPDYWQKEKPYLDRVIFRGMQNPETREAAFESGQLDVIIEPSFHFVSKARSEKRHNANTRPGFGTEGVYLNTRKPPLDDIRVRWAVAHAMDTELINKMLGFGIPAMVYSPFGGGMSSVKQPVNDYPKYDLAKAKKLIAEYGKPVAFTVQHTNTPEARHKMQALQEMWAKAGIKVELVPYDLNRLVQNMQSKEFDASLFGFTGRADPHINSFSFYHSQFAEKNPSSNYGGWKSKRVDELLETGMATADPVKRGEIYSELARVLVKEVMPVAYTSSMTYSYVARKNVKDFARGPDGLVRLHSLWKD